MRKPKILYHGTDKTGVDAILTCRYLGVRYFNHCEGVYLTDSIEDALNHGPYVFCFKNNFETTQDEVNDGYFYNGKLSIDSDHFIGVSLDIQNDRRILRDLIIHG